MTLTKLYKIMLLLCLIVAGWLMLNAWISYGRYNLHSEGRWESTKTTLAKGVWGGWEMMLSNSGLRKGTLDLSAWHGYQELTIRQPLAPGLVKFRYTTDLTPFRFILNKTDTGTTGVIFYLGEENKLCLYTADIHGRYTSMISQILPVANKLIRDEMTLSFTGDSVLISNHSFSVPFAVVLPAQVHCGFKGSRAGQSTCIDDVSVYDANGRLIFFENFNFPFRIYKISLLYFLLWAAIIGVFLYIKESFSFIAYSAFIISLGILAGFIYSYSSSHSRYSADPADIDWQDIKSNIESGERVGNRLSGEYPIDQIAGKKPVIVVVGSSQTWGAGATSPGTTYSSLLQDSLRRILDDANITVINAGVSASSSTDMYDTYISQWVKYKPVLLIVDASNNDQDTAIFRQRLNDLADYNRVHHIATLFIEEPNDNVRTPGAKHYIMRSVAYSKDVTSVEMQPYMEQHVDSGSLWWDSVHLSDYGHEVFAEHLLPYVIAEMKKKLKVQNTDTTAAIGSHK